MRSKILLATCAALLGLGVGWLIGYRSTPKPDVPAPNANTPEPNPPVPEVKTPNPAPNNSAKGAPADRIEIPLSSIYHTRHQKELKPLNRDRDEEFAAICDKLKKQLSQIRYPVAFIVQSGTIYGAVGCTSSALDGNSLGLFTLHSDLGPDTGWAVLYLGNLRDDTDVTVTSANFSAGELTVNYWIEEPPGSTPLVYPPPMYWVRLPKLSPGDVVLRAHDMKANVDTLLVHKTLR